MMTCPCRSMIVMLLAVGVVLVGPAGSQTTPPAAPAIGPTTQPAATTPGPSIEVSQPPEFTELAAKASKLKGAYVKGTAIVTGGEEGELPPELRRIEFEIWAQPPAAKLTFPPPFSEVRVTDGKFVYTLREEAGGKGVGRRRLLTTANYYHALELAAVICDAANGYKNLAAAVRFAPIDFQSEHAKKLGTLKWFELIPVVRPTHHLLTGTRTVKVGIGTDDGMMRILVGEREHEEKKSTVTVVFDTLRKDQIAAAALKLPAAAAKAEWEDADTRKLISVPKNIIEPPKP